MVVSDDRLQQPARSSRLAVQRLILVVEPTPFAAKRALSSLATGSIMAAFTVDEPAELVPALESVRDGRASIPCGMFELAARMPDVPSRTLQVLGAVVAGKTNREIARAVNLSEASVKREIASMFQTFSVTSRTALAARAEDLGISETKGP